MSRATPGLIAERAAEAIRALNHATYGGTGYQWPSDVDAVITEIAAMAHRTEQALTQAATWLDRQLAAGQVGFDDGTEDDAIAAVEDTHHDLERAGRGFAQLGTLLDATRRSSAHLTAITPTRGQGR